MALGKLLNLFALSSLAILVCNLGATPANALALDGHHVAKVKRAHGHESVAKRRRDNNGQRCKQRPSSPPPAPAVPAPAPAPAPESSQDPSQSSGSDKGDNGGKNEGDNGGKNKNEGNNYKDNNPGGGAIGGGISSGGGKIGLGWPNGNDPSLRNFVTSNTKYMYTWSEQCPSLAKELGLECMPMLWGATQDRLDAFKSTVVAGYANIAMGFNEVNEVGQSNLDVTTAVNIWREYLEPLVGHGYKLLAPVTSSRPNGFDWMKDFFSQCQGCHIDGIPVHYYGTSAQEMIDYIEKWYNQFNLDIWVTEYACQNFNEAYENNGQQCSDSQVWGLHKTIAQYAVSKDYIKTIMPFGFMKDMQGVNALNQLMSGDGAPTALGSTIVNLSFQ